MYIKTDKEYTPKMEFFKISRKIPENVKIVAAGLWVKEIDGWGVCVCVCVCVCVYAHMHLCVGEELICLEFRSCAFG